MNAGDRRFFVRVELIEEWHGVRNLRAMQVVTDLEPDKDGIVRYRSGDVVIEYKVSRWHDESEDGE